MRPGDRRDALVAHNAPMCIPRPGGNAIGLADPGDQRKRGLLLGIAQRLGIVHVVAVLDGDRNPVRANRRRPPGICARLDNAMPPGGIVAVYELIDLPAVIATHDKMHARLAPLGGLDEVIRLALRRRLAATRAMHHNMGELVAVVTWPKALRGIPHGARIPTAHVGLPRR